MIRKIGHIALAVAALTALPVVGAQPQATPSPPPHEQGSDPRIDPRLTDPRAAAPQWVAPGWSDPLFFEHEMAMVRLAHLSPNTPTVDIDLLWLDEVMAPLGPETDQAQAFAEAQAVLSGLDYGQVTGYVVVPAGRHTVRVSLSEGEGTVLFEREIELAAGAYYTVAALGFVFGTDEEIDARLRAEAESGEEGFFGWLTALFGDRNPDDLSFRLEVYNDEPGNFPRAGYAHVRVVHASPDTAELELWAWRSDLQRMTGLAPEMAPHAAPDTETPAGEETTAVPPDPALPAAPAEPLAPGAATAPAPPGVPATTGEAPTDPAFRDTTGLHFVVVADLAFPFASGYEEVRAFGYDLELRLAGTDIMVHELAAVQLEPASSYTVFVTGTGQSEMPIEAVILTDARLLSQPLGALGESGASQEEEQEDE